MWCTLVSAPKIICVRGDPLICILGSAEPSEAFGRKPLSLRCSHLDVRGFDHGGCSRCGIRTSTLAACAKCIVYCRAALAFINGIEPNSTVDVVLEVFVKPEAVTLKIC